MSLFNQEDKLHYILIKMTVNLYHPKVKKNKKLITPKNKGMSPTSIRSY